MDAAHILEALLGVVVGIVAWWTKETWAKLQRLTDKVGEIDNDLGKNYVPRSELQKTFERIFDALDDIRKEVKK